MTLERSSEVAGKAVFELPPLTGAALAEDNLAVAHEVAVLDVLARRYDADTVLRAWPGAASYLGVSAGRRVVRVEQAPEAGGEFLNVPVAMARTIWRLGAVEAPAGVDVESQKLASEAIHRHVTAWSDQRIWADNRVRELVIHDERHSRRVDALAAELAAPLLTRPVPGLTTQDAQVLSLAAWLHDWGHEGGEVAPELLGTRRHLVAEQAEEVRTLHGIITRELLAEEWRGRHGLDLPLASAVGMLCAHHQGWTSFGEDRPAKDVPHRGDTVTVRPPSLFEDVANHNECFARTASPWSRLERDRVQRLVALLRVADGCDLGLHRVPDAGAPKQAYLARAIQVRCRAARTALRSEGLPQDVLEMSLEAVHAVTVLAREVAGGNLRDTDRDGGERGLADRMIRGLLRLSDIGPVRDLAAYIQFAADQAGYYAQHGAVRSVRFAIGPVAGLARSRFEVDVVVAAVRGHEDLARESVCVDLRKELNRSDRQFTVRECLLDAGLHFRQVRLERESEGQGLPLD